MYAYFSKNNLMVVANSKEREPILSDDNEYGEFEFDEIDEGYKKFKAQGGALYIKNGIMEYVPNQEQVVKDLTKRVQELENTKPIDAVAEMNDALSASKTFSEFKTNLAAKLTK